MTKEELIKKKANLEKELNELPYISIVDDDGETNDDAYQEKLEQGWYKSDLRDELSEVNRQIANLNLGALVYSMLGGDPDKF